MSNFGSGIFYTILGRYGNFLINLGVTAALARLISPAEFGVVALLQIFTGLFQIISNSGLAAAVVQNNSLTDEDTNAIYSFSVLFAGVVSLVIPLVGLGLMLYKQDMVYLKASVFMMATVYLISITSVPNAVLMRQLKFNILAYTQLLNIIVSGIVSVTLAFAGFGVFAILTGTLTATLTDFVLKFFITNIQWAGIHGKSIYKVKSFAINILSADIIKYLTSNIDNFIVSSMFGSVALANYAKSYQLIKYPQFMIGGVFSSVLVPVLRQKQDDLAYIHNFYTKVNEFVAWISFSVSGFMVVHANEIILFVFGRQWGTAVTPFTYLALAVGTQILISLLFPMFEVLGQTKIMVNLNIVNVFLSLSLMIVGLFTHSLSLFALTVAVGIILN